MRAGYFNFNEYLKKLNEGFGQEEDDEDEKEEKDEKTGFAGKEKQDTPKGNNSGFNPKTQGSAGQGGQLPDQEGLIIPEVNQKAYQWLKKEYHKAQVEVKVEMRLGDEKFEPGYEMQSDLDSVKEFKPGMFGQVKTAGGAPGENTGAEGADKKGTLDPAKASPTFDKQEGEKPATPVAKPAATGAKPAATGAKPAAKPESKEHEGHESKEHEDKETKEHEDKENAGEKPEHKKEEDKPEVKKIDLKTKKQ